MQLPPDQTQKFLRLQSELGERIRREEALFSAERSADSLWDHLLRVAALAERLGRAEGLDPQSCYLAGLFHDAGKFRGGRYHADDQPEEKRSVMVLRELSIQHGFARLPIEEIEEAILQLYVDVEEPSLLARVLFDADNLDKLGPLGIANFFVKSGLRGHGVSAASLFKLTVELTYARHAANSLTTAAGKALAARRAPQTIRFLHDFLEALREDGLYDYRIESVTFSGIVLDVVAPLACACGGALQREIWDVPGIKCSEIHLKHTCGSCHDQNEIRFCRPRLSI